MYKWLLVVVLMAYSAWVSAETRQCVPVKLIAHNKTISLSSDAPTIYFLKNKSSQSLWIDHPTATASASAGWSSYLRPGHWAALLLDRKNFAISCASIQPGKVDYMNCAEVIAVCLPQKLDAGKTRNKTYWLVEDQPWESFEKALANKVRNK